MTTRVASDHTASTWSITIGAAKDSGVPGDEAPRLSSDPADEIIAATGLAHKISLSTRDKKLRRSKIVPLG
jgi:PIN domain nuclease of toxin-antitoxin system